MKSGLKCWQRNVQGVTVKPMLSALPQLKKFKPPAGKARVL